MNRQYSNNLFVMLFGGEENRENILSLYNALNGTSYEDAKAIEITTIDDIIYMRMKNDLSFMIDSQMNLVEQQSTFNPNMPVRGLMYLGKLYSSYISSRNLNIYSSALKRLPAPSYVVLYNGTEDVPAVMSLRLSDAFIMPEHESKLPIAAEIVATMYNLNAAENEGLLRACNKLNDYVKCVNIIRSKKLEYEDSRAAVNAAITECIEQDILSEFLVKHRAEVLEMCLTEFDEEAYKKEYIEIGREEGEAITTSKIIHSLYKSGMSASAIADALGMTTDEVNEILK